MNDLKIKPSAMEILDIIHTIIALCEAGAQTDNETIAHIKDVLNNFGFLDD